MIAELPPAGRSLIAVTALESELCLELRLSTGWHQPPSIEALRDTLYRAQWRWRARLPDHVFESSFSLFRDRDLSAGVVVGALNALAQEFVICRHGELWIREDRFGSWQQSVLSRISGVPILASARVREAATTGGLVTQVAQSLLAIPFDAAVADYIAREGLNETHLHLNGSTHSEVCWMRALRDPLAETRGFRALLTAGRGHETRKVSELARSTAPMFRPVTLWRRLRWAAKLRHVLIAIADDFSLATGPLPGDMAALDVDWQKFPGIAGSSLTVDYEREWLTRLLTELTRRPVARVDSLLHVYLLLQNRYQSLLVQSEEQYGFDQFQKLTYSRLRDRAEHRYLERFRSMHGPDLEFSCVRYLEGRFAPKKRWQENEELLRSILEDYLSYLGDPDRSRGRLTFRSLLDRIEARELALETQWPRKQRLALVVHFIKQPWKLDPRDIYRFWKLRKALDSSVSALRTLLKTHPKLQRWVRGVDGAANELHAPPEIFASAFRQSARFGLARRTFHVGEDFPHLLTGLRNMHDAIELLNLREGDRIGHGTAMGIDPALWLTRMPAVLGLKRGDRVLDLLAAWRLFTRDVKQHGREATVRHELEQLLHDLFGLGVTLISFERAMGLRGLHLDCVKEWIVDSMCPDWPRRDGLSQEADLVARNATEDPEALRLMWRWQTDQEVLQRAEEMIEVRSTMPGLDTQALIRLQQLLMSEVANRRIVIETLPSSNVRISQYEGFHEHHALRWMRIDGYVQSDDPPIMVSLGSDDPGIFANDLRADFYHLYSTLRNLGIADSDALSKVAEINERGRKFRFHL